MAGVKENAGKWVAGKYNYLMKLVISVNDSNHGKKKEKKNNKKRARFFLLSSRTRLEVAVRVVEKKTRKNNNHVSQS